jgi:hypothetical protein
VTAVDGHQAIRVSGTGTGDSLYPEGTAFTRYLIDLALGADEGAGTLFIDVVGVGDIDYDEGRRVLDLMVPTIELTAGSEPVPSTIARYEGGGTPLTVVATVEDGGRICLRPVAGPSPTCPRELGSSSIESVMLEDTESPTLAGTASAGVFRIDAVAGGGTHSFLPVAVPSAPEIKAWALPVGRDEVGELAWFDLDGNELGRTAIDSSDDGGPDPIGALDDQQASSDDAPRSGPPTLLSEVRAAGQDGFDRVVFELDGNGALSYQVELTDKVRAVSGQTVDIAGEAVIEVIMVPASLDGPGSSSDETYQGPERIDPVGTAMATEIVLVDDFESTLVWGIGVPDDARFAVALLADPQRLVIDIS